MSIPSQTKVCARTCWQPDSAGKLAQKDKSFDQWVCGTSEKDAESSVAVLKYPFQLEVRHGGYNCSPCDPVSIPRMSRIISASGLSSLPLHLLCPHGGRPSHAWSAPSSRRTNSFPTRRAHAVDVLMTSPFTLPTFCRHSLPLGEVMTLFFVPCFGRGSNTYDPANCLKIRLKNPSCGPSQATSPCFLPTHGLGCQILCDSGCRDSGMPFQKPCLALFFRLQVASLCSSVSSRHAPHTYPSNP